MKSKRVSLEDVNTVEKITDLMKKLREKYVNCETIKVSIDEFKRENLDENSDPNQTLGRNKIYRIPLQVPKSVHEIKAVDINTEDKYGNSNPISKFSEETLEETEEKNHLYKDSNMMGNIVEKVKSQSLLIKENLFLSKMNKETIHESNHQGEKSPKTNENTSQIDLLIGKGRENIFDNLKRRSQENPGNFHPYYDWIEEIKSPEDMDSSLSNSGIYLDEYSEDEFSESLYEDSESDFHLIKDNIFISSSSMKIELNAPPLEEKPLIQGKLSFTNIKFNNNNKIKSPKTYKKFGLSVRVDMPNSPSDQTHRFLPLKYKNDEKYKTRLFKYLRKPQNPHNKTETCKFVKFNKHSQHFDGNMSKYYDSFGMKMRKVSSEKKVYEAHHSFEDNRAYVDHKGQHPPQYFKFYSDKDIGFTAKWQKQLKATQMDDDVETDEDQLNAAERHIKREVGEGIRSFIKNKKNVRNFSFLNNY